ncbi:MAG: DEAD/DEAH box helicase [Synechococcus sp.]
MTQATVPQFAEFPLSEPILRAIADVGYESPSPIQAQTLPPLLEGRDLVGQAQTGTGKTAAFSLPLLSNLDLSRREPQILVLAPTRELAIQVADSMQSYGRHLSGFKITTLYGGMSIGQQIRDLRHGVHVVVGTPGRLLDHLRRGTLKLDGLSSVVLDEADEMLRMGFIDDVETILSQAPETRQVVLFSATMPLEIRKVARKHLTDPVEIKIATETATVSSIAQRFWMVQGMRKQDALIRILEAEEFDAAIIFARTKTMTAEVAELLENSGYSSAVLNGDVSQALREKTVDRLKRGSIDIVVATDVAARGLDVERISHVINYDIPLDTETYVHRIGRTGRAGRKGDAILFVHRRERRLLRNIERATRQQIEPMQLPSNVDIAGRRIAQFKEKVAETISNQEDMEFFEDLVNNLQEEKEYTPLQIAAALTYLVQKERPLRLPKEPEPRFRDDRESRERPQRRDRNNRSNRSEEGMVSYRIEVGRNHGVTPKHIVGAIANEGGINSRHIGRIRLFNTFSVVDLPDGMPPETFEHLKQVQICGEATNISIDAGPRNGGGPRRNSFRGNPRPRRDNQF